MTNDSYVRQKLKQARPYLKDAVSALELWLGEEKEGYQPTEDGGPRNPPKVGTGVSTPKTEAFKSELTRETELARETVLYALGDMYKIAGPNYFNYFNDCNHIVSRTFMAKYNALMFMFERYKHLRDL